MTDQANEQSVEDRIAERFAGLPSAENTEETPEAEAEHQQTAEPTEFDYDLDGQTIRLPLKLKDRLMMQEDYTRKTQELSDQRRMVEQIQGTYQAGLLESQFNASVAQERNELAVIDAYLAQVGRSTDVQNMTTEQLLRHKVEIDTVKERRALIQQSLNDKRAKFDADFKQRVSELRGKAREAAIKSIQGFNEDTEKSMREFARGEGLTDQELDNVLQDPRSYRIVYKAMQFDKVRAGTANAVQAAQSRVVRPGAASERMPERTRQNLEFGKAMKAAKTSGQKAQVIEGRLANMFGGKR